MEISGSIAVGDRCEGVAQFSRRKQKHRNGYIAPSVGSKAILESRQTPMLLCWRVEDEYHGKVIHMPYTNQITMQKDTETLFVGIMTQ